MAHGQLGKVMRFLRRTVVPDTAAVTDRQLLERFAQKRDEHAFAALVERHGPMVLAVCQRVLGDSHAADDAFQATFLVLAQKAPAVRWQETVGGWLHAVAYRVAQKARVDAARRRAHERQVPDVSTANPVADVSWRELRQVLDEELTRLPEKYRAPLVLCYLEGKTNEEAAQQLGWTKGTVSGQLARARDLLRSRLSRRGVALPAAACGVALTECAAPAAVSPILVTSTIKAAVLGTAAKAAAAGAVSAPVAALAEGVIQTMFVTKLKMAALIFLAVGLVAGGTGFLGYRTLAGGKPATPVALAPLPEEVRPMNAAPKASEPVEKDGLQITVKPDKAMFEPGQPLAFTVTLKNVSKDDFTLLHTPLVRERLKIYVPTGWKIHIAGEKEGILWEALPLRQNRDATPGAPPPYVLKAGQTLDVAVRLDENFVFTWKGDQLAKPMPVKQLPVGKYRLTIDMTFHGATKNIELAGKPPLWVGELTTKPAAFEISQVAALSDTAKERVKALKDSIDKFELRLLYFGPAELKPYYRLQLQTADLKDEGRKENPFYQVVKIDKAQAEKLIDHMAAKGFLDRADNIFGKEFERRGEPHYVWQMAGPEKVTLEGYLGWGEKLLKSLDEIRQGLDGDAAKKMDAFIGRLGGLQKQDAKKVLMQQIGGFGPKGGKVLSEFVLEKNGEFKYDGVQGKLPQAAMDVLIEQIEKADKGPGAEDAGTVSFKWLDKDGNEKSILFTQPRQAPDCQKLLATLADLAKKHSAGKGASKPVRVNGVAFEVLADTRWTEPAKDKRATVELAFRITNQSDKELTFNLFDTLGLRMKSADGKELAQKSARDATRPVPPIRIAAGKSETITWRAELSWLPDGKTLKLSGGDGSGTVWSFDGLQPGKYGVSFTYDNKFEKVDILSKIYSPQPFWVGKAQTEPLEIEIVRPLADQ